MLNIIELEKRWLHYKIKSYIPYVVAILGGSLIILFSIQFLKEEPIKTIKKSTPKIPVKIVTQIPIKTKIISQKASKVVILKSVKKSNPILRLKPSLGFMKNIENSSQPFYDNEMKQEIMQKKKRVQKAPKKQIAPAPVTIKEVILPLEIKKPNKKSNKSTKIQIKRKNTQEDINEIITRFKKNNNPALSLFVAKKQYELKNYNQSYNYALITNKINSNIDDSWIIFIKSLVKLGKKEQALSTLKQYLKHSHSSTAQILFNDIISGKFQ